MRLNVFISQNMEKILEQWEDFAAAQTPAAKGMSALLLRDHAQGILQAIIQDITAPQSGEDQAEKSKGLAEKLPGTPETAAETHGLLRATSGFEIKQMAGEFRALRASVLRLWLEACGTAGPDVSDVIRFNEAIDQALAESLDFFTEKLEERRNLFLEMLGHDMRTPLQAMQMTATLLDRVSSDATVTNAAQRLIKSGLRMKVLLDELIEFNKIKRELGVRIYPTALDMEHLFEEELVQLRAIYPDRRFELQVNGPTTGAWDGDSLRRLLGNLVVNAVKYGDAEAPISVLVTGAADQVVFEVCNQGAPLDAATLQGLFDQGQRRSAATNSSDDSLGLGLGLYIAKQVAKAHGGTIRASCKDKQTVFRVQLPLVTA